MSSGAIGKLVHALRGTLAVLTALGVAEFLAIENPYWAGMTALIVIQPSRGLLFEKSFYRLVGTVFGSLAALLLLLSTNSPLPLTLGLVVWIAGCVGIGNLLYGFRSYAFLMATQTAATGNGANSCHSVFTQSQRCPGPPWRAVSELDIETDELRSGSPKERRFHPDAPLRQTRLSWGAR